ncbi:hypothetical protein D3C77_331360 [compost metagenome]
MANLVARRPQSQADAADADAAGDAVVLDPALGRRRQLHQARPTLDGEVHRIAAAQGHDARHLAAVGDQLAVDVGDQVARQEARRRRRRLGLDLHHPGRAQFDAHQAEQQGEDEDGQDEVREGPARHDQGALPQRLEIEIVTLGARPVFSDHGLAQGVQARAVGNARGVQIAGELHIAAQGQPAHAPLDAVPVRPPQDGAAKADGKALHLHAEGARGEEVPEFVHRHHDRQHEQKRHDVDQDLADDA